VAKTKEKQQRIVEEKKYLERLNQQFEEEKTKKQNQKTFLSNQRMEEYQSYLNSKPSSKKGFSNGNFVKPVIENVNKEEFQNNDGSNHLPEIHSGEYSSANPFENHYNADAYQNHIQDNQFRENNINSGNNTYQQHSFDNNPNNNDNYYNPNINNDFTANNANIPPINNNLQVPNQRDQNNSSQQNYTPNFQLTDYNTNMRTRKYEQQQAYRNFLDTQVSTRSNRSQSSAKSHENSRVIPLRKNNEPKVNPFSNKNYEFGGSALGHNPILNPTNDYAYNKYMTSGNGQNRFQRAANNIIG